MSKPARRPSTPLHSVNMHPPTPKPYVYRGAQPYKGPYNGMTTREDDE